MLGEHCPKPFAEHFSYDQKTCNSIFFRTKVAIIFGGSDFKVSPVWGVMMQHKGVEGVKGVRCKLICALDLSRLEHPERI